MKKIWKYFLLLSSLYFGEGWGEAFAQNLVLNPSFEQFDTCPNNISQIRRAAGWNAARPTPDYFNACSTDTLFNGQIIVGVPSNRMGYRTASSGEAYSGIISKSGSLEDREIIGSQLATPLQIGIHYYVSFQVSLAGQANPSQYCGINKLGALFSTVLYDSLSLAPICSCPQIYSDSIIIDTLEWTRIKGSFIADSNYSFINVGRFFPNSQTDSIQIAGTLGFAYYFIDDVCISSDSAFSYNYIYTGIENLSSQNNSTQFYPNPVADFITIKDTEGDIIEVKIYNSLGQIIKIFQAGKLEEYVFDLSDLSMGIYHLQIVHKNLKSINALIIKL